MRGKSSFAISLNSLMQKEWPALLSEPVQRVSFLTLQKSKISTKTFLFSASQSTETFSFHCKILTFLLLFVRLEMGGAILLCISLER